LRWIRTGAVPAFIAAVVLGPASADGQLKVRVSGQAETNVGLDTQRIGNRTLETVTIGSRYTPALDGFVWDPRFVTFGLSGTYADQETTQPGAELGFVQREPYRLLLTFFSQAPHSFELRAARSTTDNTFTGTLGDQTTITSIDQQGVAWRYRGDARLPEASLELLRQATETETPDVLAEETRTTMTLRARKTLARSQPTGTYTMQMLDRRNLATFLEPDGLSHELRYDDQVRLGERALLSPLARVRVGDDTREAEGNLTLSGPLSTTLDASTSVRYAFEDRLGIEAQTLATTGVLTKRLGPALTVTSGVNGVLISAETSTWGAGAFTGASATPLPHLQAQADYALQLTGGDAPLSAGHRAHLGAISTYVPRHTFSADYFASLVDTGVGGDVFTSHGVTLGATSLAIPLTTVSSTVAGDIQDGGGRQQHYRAEAVAVVVPAAALSLRGRADIDTLRRAGGERPPAEETAYGIEAGIDLAALTWLTLSATGRLGLVAVDREDKRGTFRADAVRGAATVVLATLSFRTEGFMERDPIIDQERLGVRAALAYRFRVWTLGVDFERSAITTAGIDTGRDRLFFRVSRALDFSWP
jgi:hypothetical protein